MKKLVVLLLLATLALTSCRSGNKDNPADTANGSNELGNTHNNTLGDDNGDGMIEDETDDGMNGGKDILDDVVDGAETLVNDIVGGVDDLMNGGTNNMDGPSSDITDTTVDSGKPNFTAVDKVESADDALNFIAANVYSRCQDVIPLMTETKILSTDELDSITYNTGLTSADGIDDVIISDSSVDSFSYSFVMIRTDGTNTAELQSQVGESINPEKWLGVVAEKVCSVILDNDIVLVMGGVEQVDAIMNSVVDAANGVYNNIGSVVNVLG